MKDIIAITVFLLVAIAIARPVSAADWQERITGDQADLLHNAAVTICYRKPLHAD